MTPDQRARIKRQLRVVSAKALNFPAADLAARLTEGVTRATVEPRAAVLVKAVMHALAHALQDEIAELRARVDELEPGG